MDEITHLKGLWTPSPHRSTEVIEHLSHWAYSVPSAFNPALDIECTERTKDKKKYMTWTQGPYLSFKEGDVIHSSDGKSCLQVNDAKPMKWDSKKSEMDEGLVNYSEYEIRKGKYIKICSRAESQMKFLGVLIGTKENASPVEEKSLVGCPNKSLNPTA